MRAKSSLAILSTAIWWVLVNLPWIAVGSEEFTGGQLIPVMNLLPAIVITALFISLYGKLRSVLVMASVAILGLSIYVTFSTELEASAVVIAELERLSGMLNPESHEAGVSISDTWGKWAAIVANFIALFITALSLGTPKSKFGAESSKIETSDNRSLWDEQN